MSISHYPLTLASLLLVLVLWLAHTYRIRRRSPPNHRR